MEPHGAELPKILFLRKFEALNFFGSKPFPKLNI
jgi:hypothetical protein